MRQLIVTVMFLLLPNVCVCVCLPLCSVCMCVGACSCVYMIMFALVLVCMVISVSDITRKNSPRQGLISVDMHPLISFKLGQLEKQYLTRRSDLRTQLHSTVSARSTVLLEVIFTVSYQASSPT